MNVDEFIGKVEETEDHDIFTSRVFYRLDGKMFAQMCELLKEQEAQRDYEASVEMAEYCERYEQTYNPEDGSM